MREYDENSRNRIESDSPVKTATETKESAVSRHDFVAGVFGMGMMGAALGGFPVVRVGTAQASEKSSSSDNEADSAASGISEAAAGGRDFESGYYDGVMPHNNGYDTTPYYEGLDPLARQSDNIFVNGSVEYSAPVRPVEDLGATTEELDALLLDEPEVTEDLILPDGTVVDKAYVALRNRLNRLGDGLNNDPAENSFEHLMDLWTPEEAAQEVLCPNYKWFTAFDYSVRANCTVDEATDILENLVQKRLIVGCTRSGTRWYFLLAWVDGVFETHIVETDDINYLQMGLYGTDYGTGASYPITHVCPVSTDVVEGGKIDAYSDWRKIVDSFDSFGIADCICRRCSITRGDPEMQDFTREHVWKEGASGDKFIETCMVLGDYADFFIEQGIAERVTKDEMIRNIEYGIEDGFVPQVYWAQHPGIMCLCKSDMCAVLSAYRALDGNTPKKTKGTTCTLSYDREACIQCGACVERCPMQAVAFGDDGYPATGNSCVGCGQCVLTCPASARILTPKPEIPNGDTQMPFDLCEDFKIRAEERMQRGYIRDFVGTSLDDNQADNDFKAKLERLRTEGYETKLF
jgi:NAD-dependent dihydropyrimidine dehydrogenase PreA subunit